MKNKNVKIIIAAALAVVLVVSMIFLFASCKKHDHTFEEEVISEPTCETDGVLRLTCTGKKCDYVEEQAILAVGHSNVVNIITQPTCTKDGTVRTSCTKCGFNEDQTIKAPGHKKIDVSRKEPTCLSAGYTEYVKCTECSWTYGYSVIQPINHILHDVDDRQRKTPEYERIYPTCTESGSHYEYRECSMCGTNFEVTKVIDSPLGHDLTEVKARAASCSIGWDTFHYCNGWTSGKNSELEKKGYPHMPAIGSSGPYIADAENGCGYNTYVEHPAIYDHVMEAESTYVEVTAATCYNEGSWKRVRTCTTCANDWKSNPDVNWHRNAKASYPYSVVEETGTIEALGHEWQTHKGQAATCTVDGWEDFTMCSRCSLIDSPDGKVPVIKAAHTPSQNGCLLVCGACGYVETDLEKDGHKIITVTSDEENSSLEPTCVDAGYYTCIKKCAKCNQEITKEVVRVDPHGHDLVSYPAKDVTCTTVGWDAFKACQRKDCGFTEYVEKPAPGHTPDEANAYVLNSRPATCTEEGFTQTSYPCSVCGEKGVKLVYEKLDIVPHTPVTKAELAASCLKDGHNQYDYCEDCDKVLTNKVVYPALGHAIYTEDGKNATCTTVGWYAYSACSRCDYDNKADSMIPALGHDYSSANVKEYTVVTTCTANGTYDSVKYCNRPHPDTGVICHTELERQKDLTETAYGHSWDANGYCERYAECGKRKPSENLSYTFTDDGVLVGGRGSCTDTVIVIPDTINGMKVVGIGNNAFWGTNITEVVIGENVREIGENAFFKCLDLETVTIGANVTKIGVNAFDQCLFIENVYYVGTNWDGIVFANPDQEEYLTSKLK